MPRIQAKRWVFTLNNYTAGEEQLLSDLLNSEHVEYGVFGREVGDSGTPHLQGYVIFAQRKEFNQAKRLLGQRVHLEKSNGTPGQAAAYCKKDGDFEEFGSLPEKSQGKRSDWERLRDWCKEQTQYPSDYELMEQFPTLFGRYDKRVRSICNLLINPDPIQIGEPRQWQRDVGDILDGQPDDRRVLFVVDEEGNSGKSWMKRWYWAKNQQKVQLLSIGKRDDIAHALDERKSIFIFDVPRGSMEYLQYSVLEMIKDGIVFSPKYESGTKMLTGNSHVVVLCNEEPDMNKLTRDRYWIYRPTGLNHLVNNNNN